MRHRGLDEEPKAISTNGDGRLSQDVPSGNSWESCQHNNCEAGTHELPMTATRQQRREPEIAHDCYWIRVVASPALFAKNSTSATLSR